MCIVLSRLGNVDRIGRSRKIVPLTFFPELIFSYFYLLRLFQIKFDRELLTQTEHSGYTKLQQQQKQQQQQQQQRKQQQQQQQQR